MEGQMLQDQSRGPVTREQLKKYALASGDMNPIHLEEDFAKQAGYPSVIAHGMLSMAFIADVLRHHFPSSAYQTQTLSCRFKKVIFPGDELRIKGKVKGRSVEGLIQVSMWIENQKGELTTQAEACVKALQSKPA